MESSPKESRETIGKLLSKRGDCGRGTPRAPTLTSAIYYLHLSEGSTIVETGTIRDKTMELASVTELLVSYLKTYCPHGTFYSVDVDPVAVAYAEGQCGKIFQSENIHFVLQDSVEFLTNFNERVDLLYLDSASAAKEDGAKHQLNEIKGALKSGSIHPKTVILLDDTDISNHKMANEKGKGCLVVPYLVERGWDVINEDGCQALLLQKKAWEGLL